MMSPPTASTTEGLKELAGQTVESIVRGWDHQELIRRADPRLGRWLRSRPVTTRRQFEAYARRFGQVLACDSSNLRVYRLKRRGSDPVFRCIWTVIFEGGRATVLLSLRRKESAWLVNRFRIETTWI